ncbi:MAG TPA: alpha-amylase family glycosyl hydrolase [Deltaproteobacteria bacterium]|jgi:hypothetical protein|nr:alpha-amylase family glycosyl hydrolase [Deltaproteobacteria bacterium]HQI00687.1 alpha-amylase family glycosyl hydrolase [Deltaproteobacteria bacterium]HQJ08612.1 alpha-amylase family glycosyl hydrolase [Deltaproteobacteria bacterium]
MKHGKTLNPHLLEINAFAFMSRMREKYGRGLSLGTIPANEWQEVASQGFSSVWLMGVWERSFESRECALKDERLRKAYDTALPGWTDEDVKGSPYAVHSYTVDSFLGSGQDLLALKSTLNGLGMGLILDFVPNHLAIDHPWTASSPEMFIEGGPKDLEQDPPLFFRSESGRILAHGRDPYFPAWRDTVQVNPFSPSGRRALINELIRIADCADGVRCDMAMLVLNEVFAKTWGAYLEETPLPEKEFWTEAISEVKALHPSFTFMAEAYWDLEYRLQQLGFDYTYDKRLYDLMLHADVREIRAHLHGDECYQKRCIRFIENHDERRAVDAFGRDRSCAAAVVMATAPGLHLFHDGQLEGAEIHLPIQLARRGEERADPSIRDFYDRLLAFAAGGPFTTGSWRHLDVRPAWSEDISWTNLLAWIRHGEGTTKLVCVNYSDSPSQGRLRIVPELIQAGPLAFRDRLTDEVYIRTTDEILSEGLYVELGPWKSHLFDLLS